MYWAYPSLYFVDFLSAGFVVNQAKSTSCSFISKIFHLFYFHVYFFYSEKKTNTLKNLKVMDRGSQNFKMNFDIDNINVCIRSFRYRKHKEEKKTFLGKSEFFSHFICKIVFILRRVINQTIIWLINYH